MKHDDYIAYHMTTGGNNNRPNGPGSSGGCFTAIAVFVLIVLLISGIGSCSRQSNNKYSSSNSYIHSPSKKICLYSGCSNTKMTGGNYCFIHTCHTSGCYNRVTDGSGYCLVHKHTGNTGTSGNTKKSTTGGANKSTQKAKTDPYHAADYSDYEDFYDDWYDDFDGIDEAEEYWEEWQNFN